MNDPRVNDTDSILNLLPLAVMITNIDVLADNLYMLLGPYLLNDDLTNNSIYIKGTGKRLTNPKEKYYTREGIRNNQHLLSLDGVKEDVLNDRGSVVIPKEFMLASEKTLEIGGSKVTKMAPFILASINGLFNTCLKQHNQYNARSKYLSLLSHEATDIIDNGDIDVVLEPLLNKVHSFIGYDIWNIYFVNIVGGDVFVNKSHDFRIYEWTKQNELQAEDVCN